MIYFLTGRESLLKGEFIRDLKARFFKTSSEASMNFQEFHSAEQGFSSFMGFIQTAPFLSEKRVGVLWEIEELEDEEADTLLDGLKQLPGTSVVVFSSDETSANLKKNKFLAALSEVSSVVACHAPFEKDLPSWIQTRVRKSGKTIDGEAVKLLIERVGKEPALLLNSLETLFTYIHPRSQVTGPDVESLVGRSAQEDAFALIDEILKKNTKSALMKIEVLSREGVRAPELIGILAGQLERLRKALELYEQKTPISEIYTMMRVPFFNQDKFFAQLKRTNARDIKRMQKRLLECDSSIKEGRQGERAAIQRFALES